jgi:hypothetical protein
VSEADQFADLMRRYDQSLVARVRQLIREGRL